MSDHAPMTTFTNDGYTFDVIDTGPAGSDTVVCLHGFPQSARSWDKVTPLLTDAGFRVLCPHQRGYSPGARPTDRRAYAIDNLVGDIVALIDQAGTDQIHLVGHDWGAAVAWRMAATHPDRVATLTPVSVPHPAAMQKAVLRSTQGLKSWYMLAFQVPWFPEKLLGSQGGRRLAAGLVGDGLSRDASEETARLAADPLTRRTMVNWYRGLPFAQRGGGGPITMPTTFIWSDHDRYLGRWGAEHTADFVSGPYRFVEVTGGTHWLPDTHPEVIADAVVAQATEFPG